MTTSITFSSGVISNTSSIISGKLVHVTLSSIPTMVLYEQITIDGTYDKGLFSITIKSDVKEKWNFYLETKHSNTEYILYSASGVTTNQYDFYKETLELHAGLNDIYTYKKPAYMWATTIDGQYSTGLIPVYFRKIS